jgi:hypothetical protein
MGRGVRRRLSGAILFIFHPTPRTSSDTGPMKRTAGECESKQRAPALQESGPFIGPAVAGGQPLEASRIQLESRCTLPRWSASEAGGYIGRVHLA